MNYYLDEIGLEREVWLLDNNGKIMEPKIYWFPNDDFGFLIEERTRPHDNPEMIIQDLDKLHEAIIYQAKLFNLRIVLQDEMSMGNYNSKLINMLSEKYGYGILEDLTANINSGVTKSHATGIIDNHLTAGLHVHFSRKTSDGKRVQLPMFKIVSEMDKIFFDEIKESKRMHGEFEVKPYGFEWRSLPATADIKKVLNTAFSMFSLENIEW